MHHLVRALLFTFAACAAPTAATTPEPPVATFSIVACDLEAGEWGVAVQSRFLAVGAVVPFAQAGVGAVATQAWANTTYGPRGLELLAAGRSAQEVVDLLTAADERAARRQVGVVDRQGRAAVFTGADCSDWAGGRSGEDSKGCGYCVQGNILAGQVVTEAMAAAFEQATGDLGDRMIAALQAGQDAGGDKRGMQSAALLIVKQGAGYGGFNDRYRDVRVDDHERPIQELQRIYTLHKRTFRAR